MAKYPELNYRLKLATYSYAGKFYLGFDFPDLKKSKKYLENLLMLDSE